MTNVTDWNALRQRYDAWWRFDNTDRPIMWIEANRESTVSPAEIPKPVDMEDEYINPIRADIGMRNKMACTAFLAEAYPNATLNYGPGAMAAFLDCRPHFTRETVWYEPLPGGLAALPGLLARFDTEYYLKAKDGFETLASRAAGDYLVTVPDLIDSMDTLASILGTEPLLYALMDSPEAILAGSDRLDDIYFEYFEIFRRITMRGKEDVMGVQAFNFLGSRVAKLQCDFCAMISPDMFRTFVEPSIQKYCMHLDHALYHIDGEDEIRHVDALLGIRGLDAFQWIPQGSSTGTSFTDPKFYPLFDKIHEAGKGLYLSINRGTPEDWAEETRRLIRRYGSRGMFFLYPRFPDVHSAEVFLSKFS